VNISPELNGQFSICDRLNAMERSAHQKNEKGYCNSLHLSGDESSCLPIDGF
jgi:hypothetical protein